MEKINISPTKKISSYINPVEQTATFNKLNTLIKGLFYIEQKRNLCFNPPLTVLFWNVIKEGDSIYTTSNIYNIDIKESLDIIVRDLKADDVIIKIDTCNNESKRFIAIPLLIDMLERKKNKMIMLGGHLNVLIYDIKRKILTRYEPHGCGHSINYNQESLENYLNSIFTTFLLPPGSKYYSIYNTCNYRGFQIFQRCSEYFAGIEWDKIRKKDMGFCLSWSLFFLDMKLKYPDISNKMLENKIFDYFQDKNLFTPYKLTRFIHEYALNIISFSQNKDIIKNLEKMFETANRINIHESYK